jgi:hypothetical protein
LSRAPPHLDVLLDGDPEHADPKEAADLLDRPVFAALAAEVLHHLAHIRSQDRCPAQMQVRPSSNRLYTDRWTLDLLFDRLMLVFEGAGSFKQRCMLYAAEP